MVLPLGGPASAGRADPCRPLHHPDKISRMIITQYIESNALTQQLIAFGTEGSRETFKVLHNSANRIDRLEILQSASCPVTLRWCVDTQ